MTTHDPIIKKVSWTGFSLFRKRPIATPGEALVLYRDSGHPVQIIHGERVTGGEVAWGNFKGYYIVDIGEKSFNLHTTLPCRKDVFNFQADVQVVYQVFSPEEVVKNRVSNMRELLEAPIIKTMRKITRNFSPERSKEAEEALLKYFKENKIRYSGVRVKRFEVNLNLDDLSRTHLRELTQLKRQQATVKAEHNISLLKDQLDIERKKMKMEFYGPLIEKGQWQLLALQLANNENDILAISQMLNQQRQIEMDTQLKALKILLEEDAVEAYQVGDAGKKILQKLVDNINPQVGTNLFEDAQPKQLTDDKADEASGV